MSMNIVVPPLGESVTEATVAKWHKKVGDYIKSGEIILELETDKVNLEVTSSSNGILEKILCETGSSVKVNQELGVINTDAKPDISVSAPEAQNKALEGSGVVNNTQNVQNDAQNAQKIASPAAAKIASENKVELANIAGTGRDGRVTKEDVLKSLDINPGASKIEAKAPEFNLSATEPRVISGSDNSLREKRVKMTRLRKTIASRLKDSQNTAAIWTTFNEIDMSAVIEARQVFQERFLKKHGVKLGFMSFFVKAVIQALKEIPAVNATIEGDDIVYKNYYDIGVAVGTENGLVVPVLRDADSLSFAEVEKGIAALGQKAKDGKLSMNDMAGGTFSITNGGIYGSMLSTPIINPPQSGILGMHNIVERPCVVKGQVVIRPIMYVALSYDHRIIDGREAVTFLVRIKDMIETPERLLFDI